MRITQLNHVALHVGDLARSVWFYRDVLGLSEVPRPAFDFAGAWFGVPAGSGGPVQEVHLIARPAKESPYTVPRERHFAFLVEDAAGAAAELRGKGVACSGPSVRPDGALQVFLRDPDGHVVELCQPAAG